MRSSLCVLNVARFLAAAMVVGALTVTSAAQTVLLDLGNSSSFRGVNVTNPDANGHHWNSVWAGAFYPNIVDINGNATPIDFGFSADGGNDSFNGPAGVTSNPPTAAEIAATDIDAAALGNLGVKEAAMDFYVNSRFQIQQLDPAKRYNITFFGSHKFNNDNTTRYTIYTDGTFTTPVASADLLVGVDNSHNRDRVVTISSLAPQAGNILYVGFAGANGGNGYLNALEITAIPEPSTMLLVAGASALIFSLRRP
jgi:PEP-CTERM motif